jgi:Flp pilus assembly protein TadG
MRRFRKSSIGDASGSVSVEMALITTLFLIPLLLGSWDGLYALAARYQTNAALSSLYYFAWSNPDQATNITDIQTLLNAVNQTSVAVATIPINNAPTISYNCLQSDGTTTSATRSTSASGNTTETCESGTLQTNVTYYLQASVDLPFGIPSFNNPMIITAAGTITIQ